MIAGQAEDAVAGPEAVFRIVLARHQSGDEGVDMGPEIAGPLLQPGAGLLDAGAPMRHRPVLLDRAGAALRIAAQMAGDLAAAVEDVDHLAAQADVDLLADILVRHRVEVPLDGDVIVGMDRVLAPQRALPAARRQRLHVREIDALEALVAGLAGAVGIGPGVDLPDLGGDRAVQRRQIMEHMVAQRRQDPAFAVQHPVLDQGLVARLPDPRGEALDAVMVEQIGVGLVQHRLVARRLLHRRLDVVGHHHPRRPAHVLEAAHVRGAPAVDLLAQRRLGVEPPRHPHRRDEQLRLARQPAPTGQPRRRLPARNTVAAK